MFEHALTLFGKVPEISLDDAGFDSWSAQGVIRPAVIGTPVSPTPDWLTHSQLKSPWLYAEKSTPSPHVAYTDIGDARFVSTDGSCPAPVDHPALILNTPANKVHVTLEEITNTVNPKVLWDNWFSLKNSAPGGNGTKIVSYQTPVDGPGQAASFIPFCFKGVRGIDFFETKYRLSVESVADDKDISVVPWKDAVILRPRPLCDIPTGATRMA